MEITIKELAEKLGVSKTTIRRAIEALDLQGKLHKIGNRFLLNEEQAEIIKAQISLQESQQTKCFDSQQTQQAQQESQQTPKKANQTEHKSQQTKQTQQEQIVILQQQLTIKDAQIAELLKQLSTLTESLQNTTAALAAAQALHAGTMQQQISEHSETASATSKQKFWERLFKKK